MPKTLFDLSGQLAACHPAKRLIANIVAKVFMRMADKIEHRQTRLLWRLAKPAPQLLQEDRGALGRAQKEHRVDLGNFDALIKKIDREDHLQLPAGQAVFGAMAVIGRRVAGERERGNPRTVELGGHKLGVLNIYAEPERLHLVRIKHPRLDRP